MERVHIQRLVSDRLPIMRSNGERKYVTKEKEKERSNGNVRFTGSNE